MACQTVIEKARVKAIEVDFTDSLAYVVARLSTYGKTVANEDSDLEDGE